MALLLHVQVAMGTSADPNREHIDQINTYQVFYEIKYNTDHLCEYKIINRGVLTMLWQSGIEFLKKFGAKVSANPAYLIQPPFTQSANDEIRVTGKDAADYYIQMEELLRARHDSQDQALDNLLAEIEAAKGTANLQQIRNLDPDAITALQLAKERFLLTSEQIQEKLVYYDLLDDKVEKTIDKMLFGYLDSSGQLPPGWVAPENIQFMATTEMHLDNFREILNDTKKLTQYLAQCYGDLRTTYIANLVNTTPEIELVEKQNLIASYQNAPYPSGQRQFVKPQDVSLEGILDASSTKYQDKLKKNILDPKTQNSPAESMSNIRHQIAAHSKIAADSGSILGGTTQERVSDATAPNTNNNDKLATGSGEKQGVQKVASDNSQKVPMGTLAADMLIDSKKLLAEIKSDEHSKSMVIDLSGRSNRMNDTEYQAFRRSTLEYQRQEDDTLFTIISKAYHRVAFPIFLMPEVFEAMKSKR